MHTAKRLQKRLNLDESQATLCLTDYKRQCGLMFGILVPCCLGYQSIIYPFIVAKQKPDLWIETAAGFGVTVIVATSKAQGLKKIIIYILLLVNHI